MRKVLTLMMTLAIGGCCSAKDYWKGDTSNCVPALILLVEAKESGI